MMDEEIKKLQLITSKCKAGFSLNYREHSNYHEHIKELVKRDKNDEDGYFNPNEFLNKEELRLCVETDKYWTIHFYPITPVGFYHAHAHNLTELLDWALAILENNNE